MPGSFLTCNQETLMPAMPFQYVLTQLLANNENAVGALFVDDTGETVDHAATEQLTPNDLKVLGAYVGIYLRQISQYLPRDEYGEARFVHIENERMHLYALPLPEDYYLVLAQRTPAMTAQSRRMLAWAGQQLVEELFDS